MESRQKHIGRGEPVLLQASPVTSPTQSEYNGFQTYTRDARNECDHKGKDSRGRWLNKVNGWFSTSEPSIQALKQHRKDTYKKAGVSMKDPNANTKLHISRGQIPAHAIKPAGRGPDPEDIVRKNAEKARLQARQSVYDRLPGSSHGSRTSHSSSSQPSSQLFYKSDAVFPYD